MVFFKIGFRIYFILQKEAPHFQNIPPPFGGGIFLNIQLEKNPIVISITTPLRGVVIDMTSFFYLTTDTDHPHNFLYVSSSGLWHFTKWGVASCTVFAMHFATLTAINLQNMPMDSFLCMLTCIIFWGWLCIWHDALHYPQWPVSVVSQLYLEGHVLHVYVQLSTPMKKNYTQYYCGHHLAFFAWT